MKAREWYRTEQAPYRRTRVLLRKVRVPNFRGQETCEHDLRPVHAPNHEGCPTGIVQCWRCGGSGDEPEPFTPCLGDDPEEPEE